MQQNTSTRALTIKICYYLSVFLQIGLVCSLIPLMLELRKTEMGEYLQAFQFETALWNETVILDVVGIQSDMECPQDYEQLIYTFYGTKGVCLYMDDRYTLGTCGEDAGYT